MCEPEITNGHVQDVANRNTDRHQHASPESSFDAGLNNRKKDRAHQKGEYDPQLDAVKNYLTSQRAAGHTLEQAAAAFGADEISQYLYTAGQPDPELLIRTSGEQRLGGFLLWQSALSELYFCEAYWPDFRRVDFLRALRAYSERHRRLGA